MQENEATWQEFIDGDFRYVPIHMEQEELGVPFESPQMLVPSDAGTTAQLFSQSKLEKMDPYATVKSEREDVEKTSLEMLQSGGTVEKDEEKSGKDGWQWGGWDSSSWGSKDTWGSSGWWDSNKQDSWQGGKKGGGKAGGGGKGKGKDDSKGKGGKAAGKGKGG